jgi:hypothetical protein
MKWAGHAGCMVEMRNAYRILVERPKNKRLLGRLRCRIKLKLKSFLRVWTGFTWQKTWTSGGFL